MGKCSGQADRISIGQHVGFRKLHRRRRKHGSRIKGCTWLSKQWTRIRRGLPLANILANQYRAAEGTNRSFSSASGTISQKISTAVVISPTKVRCRREIVRKTPARRGEQFVRVHNCGRRLRGSRHSKSRYSPAGLLVRRKTIRSHGFRACKVVCQCDSGRSARRRYRRGDRVRDGDINSLRGDDSGGGSGAHDDGVMSESKVTQPCLRETT